jgi:two-component system phosphate regulon sensor histidine kinase PhoR
MFSKDQQIKELAEHNDELENYFTNTIIPQLFIDSDLILRKFTPPAYLETTLVNLLATSKITSAFQP